MFEGVIDDFQVAGDPPLISMTWCKRSSDPEWRSSIFSKTPASAGLQYSRVMSQRVVRSTRMALEGTGRMLFLRYLILVVCYFDTEMLIIYDKF
ncbi:MAG: hypothetical protein KDJ28_03110 [Candidatus Competibacteraceae bacterium]|nr:hypothetical protein [Candidatus Competibacteraceae bacterium]